MGNMNNLNGRSGLYTTDMTQGNVMMHIVRFFIPLFLGNLFQQMYNMVDLIIVGKGLGDNQLAAVGACGSVNFFVMGFLIGLTGGMGILISQAYGAGDRILLRRFAAMSIIVCLAVGIIVTIFSLLFVKSYFVFMQTPDDIISGSLHYFRIILCGVLVTIINNLCLNLLRALGDGKTPLKALIFSSVTNIGLDLFLILVVKVGVAGAALATVTAQLFSIIYCIGRIRNIPELAFEKDDWEIRPELIKKLIFKGLPVAFMNSITAVGGMVLQFFVNRMGSSFVAAYAACNRITALAQQPGQAVGLTMLTYVGQNLGAGKIERIRTGVGRGVLLSIIANIPIAALMILFPEQLTGTMLTDSSIIALTKQYLPIAGTFMFVLGCLFVFRASCQGMGETLVPMFSGGLEVALRVGVVVSLSNMTGLLGIVLSEVSAWTGAWLMLMIFYFYMIHKKTYFYKKTEK